MKSFDTFSFVERMIVAAIVIFVFSILPACSNAENANDEDIRKVNLRKGEKFVGMSQAYKRGSLIITTERPLDESPKCYTVYRDPLLWDGLEIELRICEQ
nr:MAG TPA: hypothetical protein [Caudoviricetes sp.]